MNAFETYNNIAEEFGITEDLTVKPVAKLRFAREQAEQMKIIVNRFLFDITMTQSRMEQAQDEDSKAAFEGKLREYGQQLRQTRDGLKVALELVKELESVVSEG